MSIRVLHIIGSLKLGGAQVCLKYLVENASKEIETFVYPLRCKDAKIPVDCDLITFPYVNYNPWKFFAILKICRKYHIDIIHAHLEKPILGSLLATFFCGARVIIHEHGPVFRKGWKYCIYRFLLRLLRKRASVFIAVSNAAADLLIQKVKVNPNLIKVVHNAVDRNIFGPDLRKRQRVREKLLVNQNDVVLGYVGRLNYVKGVDLLINAMPLLLKQYDHYYLVIVGQGDQHNSLKNLSEQLGVADHVRFLGFCDNVTDTMNAFDIGVIPSRQEPFGIVALEFMSTKIPIVCSGVDGLAEFVKDGVTTLVTQNNDPVEICTAVSNLINDANLRKKLIDSAYQYSEKFAVPNYVKAIEEIYKEVLGQNS